MTGEQSYRTIWGVMCAETVLGSPFIGAILVFLGWAQKDNETIAYGTRYLVTGMSLILGPVLVIAGLVLKNTVVIVIGVIQLIVGVCVGVYHWCRGGYFWLGKKKEKDEINNQV